MHTSAEMSLTGPTGQVYALAVASELLFAATQVSLPFFVYLSLVLKLQILHLFDSLLLCLVQDGRILAWRFSATTNCFEPAASLDGHKLAVVSLIVGGMRLYSSSMDKTIRVCKTCSLALLLSLEIDSISEEVYFAS